MRTDSRARESNIHSDHFLPSFFEDSEPIFSLERDSNAFLMTVESTLLITTQSYKSARLFDPDESSSSRALHDEESRVVSSCTLSWASRTLVLFSSELLLKQHRQRKKKYSCFHDGGSIVSRISIAMCVGRGGFQDQDIARPRLLLSTARLVTLRLTPAALAFYCQLTVLAWITSIIYIFIAEINTNVYIKVE